MFKKAQKILLTVFMLSVVAVLAGCNSGKGKLSDYFPANENALFSYNGSTEDINSYEIFFDYIEGNTFQRRLDVQSQSASVAEVFTYKNNKDNNELLLTYSDRQGIGFIFDKHLNDNNMEKTVLLKEPLTLDSEWTRFKSADFEIKAKITALDKEISVPFGDFKTMEVTLSFSDGTVNKEYYAKGIGLIKEERIGVNFMNDGTTEEFLVYSELASVKLNAPREKDIYVFHPQEDCYLFELATLSIPTNFEVSEMYDKLTSVIKPALNNYGSINLSNDTAIKNIKTDLASYQATVTMSSSFITDMKNSKFSEARACQAMVNTFSLYTECTLIKFIVDGKEYQAEGLDYDFNGFTSADYEFNYPVEAVE